MRRTAIVLAAGALALFGCGERTAPPAGQIRLQVTTDAPLPSGAVPALFDRLRIDLYEPGAASPCADCTREFPMDTSLFDLDPPPSIGVVPPASATGYRARARLFRALDQTGDEPPPTGTLDTTIALPPTQTDGYVDVAVFLHTDDLGVPRGSPDRPVDPDPGPAPRGVVGTWSGAARRPCSGAPRAGEACVPGGASWMGSPRAGTVGSIGSASDALRIVVRSPFFVDVTEITVGGLRASDPVVGAGLAAWVPDPTGYTSEDAFCTYTAEPGPHEGMPVNCVDWTTARAHCASRGGDLLTEAQYEALAGGLASTLYVWGDDDPACGDAVFANAGAGWFSGAPGDCRAPGTLGGVLPAGSGKLDTLALEGGSVVDLAGNLAEWAADQWNREDEPCWSAPGVYVDPRCDEPSRADGVPGHPPRPVRGGDWTVAGSRLRAALRGWNDATQVAESIGFRCARADP